MSKYLSYCLAVLYLVISHDATAIEFIAHRGNACGAIENSVVAVNQAWWVGADGVELDVRRSSDGILLLFHDADIDGRLISEMTHAELKSTANYAVATLEEVLNLGEPPGYYVLDLKAAKLGSYQSLASLIAASGIKQSNFVIQSQSVDLLAEIAKQLPDARYFYLTHLKRKFPFFGAPKSENIIKKVKPNPIDGVSLKGRKFINERFVSDLKNAGYAVNIWTINDPERVDYYWNIGVNGIITDIVTKLRPHLKESVNAARSCLPQ